jgi:hypothetical protein
MAERRWGGKGFTAGASTATGHVELAFDLNLTMQAMSSIEDHSAKS